MKYTPALFLLLSLSLACNPSTESKIDFNQITITMDTVMVDPGEDIINLRTGLWNSVLNEDLSKLYLFDQQSSELAIVDLNRLVLEKKIPFEQDGPNGTGPYVTWINLVNSERILLANFSEVALFDLQGNKLRTYHLNKEPFEGLELSEGSNFYQKAISTHDGNILWGRLGSFQGGEEPFIKADFDSKRIKEIKLPGKELLQDYPLTLKMENMNGVMPSVKSIHKAKDKLILANSAYANLFVVDAQSDSAYQIDYTPKLTAKGKKGGYPSEVDSEQRFREVAEQIHAEINFIAPIWDNQNRRFYRFSFETSPTGIYDGPLFKMPENRPISAVYLSIFDENLNLIGETLTDLTVAPSYAFVKDGVIWIYINIDDELGFIQMKIN